MKKIDWKKVNALCDSLPPARDELVRSIVTQVAEKWTLWTMAVLAAVGGPMRFSRVMEHVEGISQKSLTKTLRQLERHGFVSRAVFPEVPPRVEYEITALGNEMLGQVHPVWLWALANAQRFEKAQAKYDAKAGKR